MRIADLLRVKQPKIYGILARQFGVEVEFGDAEKVMVLIGDDYMAFEVDEEVKRMMEEKKGVHQ